MSKPAHTKALRGMTPELLCTLGLEHHGRGWKATVAVKLRVHRTTVVRWASGKTKISHIAEQALLRYFKARMKAKK